MIESKFTPIKGAALRIAEEFAASDTAPVEDVVLPNDPGNKYADLRFQYRSQYTHDLERQLREAIAQRDEALEAAKFCEEGYSFQFTRANKAEAALAAMTEDRNLCQDAHNEDCPNKVAPGGSEDFRSMPVLTDSACQGVLVRRLEG